jgi:hypothetical protein
LSSAPSDVQEYFNITEKDQHKRNV